MIWVTTLLANLRSRFNGVFQLQTIHSIEYSANQGLLEVDPIFHTTKSSGEILSKVQRGSDSYEDVMDILTFELFPLLVRFTTLILTFLAFDWRLSLVSLVFLALIAVINIYGNIFSTKTFRPRANKIQDKLKAVTVENLQQANFIRSIFATPEQMQKMKITSKKNMVAEGNAWRSDTYISTFVRVIYLMSMFTIGLLTFSLLNSGSIDLASALAIMLAYLLNTNNILYLGNKVKRLTRSLIDITDLFTLMNTFGEKSYPVLEVDNLDKIKTKYY